MKFSKEARRLKIRRRIRKTIKGTPERPRLSVFRSNTGVYCQLIDDLAGHTLVSANYKEKGISEEGITKTEQARRVGMLLAEKAKGANISGVVFDRAGYLYHGRVKALADGAREGGLHF
ncbi:MAG: ribosomal protein [Bacteroidota bacterium]|jgi:large subunit ribosomal protein L18